MLLRFVIETATNFFALTLMQVISINLAQQRNAVLQNIETHS